MDDKAKAALDALFEKRAEEQAARIRAAAVYNALQRQRSEAFAALCDNVIRPAMDSFAAYAAHHGLQAVVDQSNSSTGADRKGGPSISMRIVRDGAVHFKPLDEPVLRFHLDQSSDCVRVTERVNSSRPSIWPAGIDADEYDPATLDREDVTVMLLEFVGKCIEK